MGKFVWDDTKPVGHRWVPIEEASPLRSENPHPVRPRGKAPTVMPDITPFEVKGQEITSRSHLRDFERDNNVRQCGELKTVGDFDNRVHKEYQPAVPLKE